MNIPIKTNKLIDNTINHSLIDEKYDILCVKTSEKYFRSGAYIIDAPAFDKNVYAVQFTEDNKFYVMMRKAQNNKRLLHEIFSDVKGAEFITVSHVKSSELKNRTLLQLLLNSLGNVENSLLKFNNITGHFYCFHPKWIKRNKKDNSVLQIKSLEISISFDYRL